MDTTEPPPASVDDLPHMHRQVRQHGDYHDAALTDFQEILDTLAQMSRPDETPAHRVVFTLAGFYRFRVEAQTPGAAEILVSFSAGTMFALEDFFTRLACHGGFFSASRKGKWWYGCTCFWVGLGDDVRPHTRYYDYRPLHKFGFWRTWLSGFYFGIPLDERRLAMSQLMFRVAVLWLMMHEEAHYCEGQLHYVQSQMAAHETPARISETEGVENLAQDPALRRVMEWEADRTATRAVLDVVHQPWMRPVLAAFCPGDPVALRRLILTAIGCAILIMDKGRQIYGQSATYPTTRTRLLAVIVAATAHGLDRASEHVPEHKLRGELSRWTEATALALTDIRVAAHVLHVEGDLADPELGTAVMPPLDDTLLRAGADFQAAWAAAYLATHYGINRINGISGHQRDRYLELLSEDSALSLLDFSAMMCGLDLRAPDPDLADVRQAFGRWWTELAVILDRHDNYIYDAMAPYRAAATLSTEGAP